jgi:hypothetical protein
VDNDLPFIDEHKILVTAPAAAVWHSLGTQFTGSRIPGTEAFVHLVGADQRRVSGTALTEGATLPGFRVAEAEPEAHVSLAGRHRFSRYVFDFTLVPEPGGTMLIARSFAEFPGLLGGVYRQLVIGSGGHRVIVRHMIRTIARRAERTA